MATVDNKVVSLEFNNSRFTGNVQSTMSALDRLKEKLSFKDGTKGFENIQNAANQVKIDNISHGIEGVSKGFMALSTVAITALSQITSKAMSTGSQMASAFTIQPMKDGFQEYSMNIGAIQTILANTDRYGTKLPEVTANLDELNEYSDKTIYNFGEMVKNIGLFTNAGIRIEDATSMIKGFSNVAAASGTTAEGAAGAAYQLSQALSTGTVRLMDWKSLTNVGMGNKNMQEGLVKLADSMGELDKAGTSATEVQKDFNGSLEKKWLSADVMSKYLRIMAGDMDYAAMAAEGLSSEEIKWFERQQKIAEESATKVRTFGQLMGTIKESIGSGWSETARTIVGDFDQATTLFTNLNNYFGGMIGASANARNLILKDWEQHGGRDTLMQGFLYAWEDILSILRPVGQAFREVFPKKNTQDLLNMTRSFRDLFKNFKMGEGVTSAIKGVFTVFFTVIKTGFKIVTGLVGVFFKLVGAVGAFVGAVAKAGGGALKAFFSAIGNLFKTLTGGAGDAAKGALDGISSGAEKLGTWLGNLMSNLKGVTEKIQEFTENLKKGDKATGKAEKSTSRFAGIIEWFKNVFSGIKDFFSSLFGGVSSFGEMISNLFSKIGSGLGKIGGGLSNAFKNINWNTVIGGVGVGAGVMLVKRIKEFLDATDIEDLLQGIADSLKGVLDAAADALKSFSLQVKAEAIMKIAIAVALLTAALVVLASIDPVRLGAAGAAMAVLFVALNKSITSMMSLKLPSGAQMAGLGFALIGVAGAILILSFALNKIKDLDNGDISAGLGVIAALLAGLTVAAKQMAKDTGTLAKAGFAMIGMAVAVYILTFALERMAKLDPAKAIAGAVAVAAAMGSIAAALKWVDEKESAKKGLAFLLVGIGLNAFAKAVSTFGTMKWEVLKQGFAVIVAILGGLVLFFKALPNDMILIASEILIISIAMNVLAYAVKAMGSMDWDTMKQGLIGIAAALVIFAFAAQIMNSAIVGAGAIVIMAVGLTLLAGAVATFGQMGVDTMIKSILGIAAVLVVIAAAGALMGAISPLLLAGGIAFTVLGLGMLLFGAGAWLAASAIIALAGASGAGVATAIVAMKLLAAAIPGFIAAFAKGLIEGLKTILDAIPGLMVSAGKALYALATTLIKTVARVIHDNIDSIVQAGMDILLGLMRGIRDNIGELADTAAEIIVEYVNGVAAAIEAHSQEIGDAGRRLAKAMLDGIINIFLPESLQESIGNMINGMIQYFKDLLGISSPSQVFMDLAGNIIEGLWNGLTAAVPKVLQFFWELPGKILGALGDLLSFLIPKGLELLGSLLTGIWQALPEIALFFITLPFKVLGFLGNLLGTLLPKGLDLLKGLLSGLIQKLPEIASWIGALPGKIIGFIGDVGSKLLSKGKDLLQGLKNGAVEKWTSVKEWFTDLPGKVVTAIGNITEKLKEVGGNIVDGIKSGISAGWNKFTTWVKEQVDKIPWAVRKALGIESPSKVMAVIGGYFVDGFRLGMAREWDSLHAETAKNTNTLLDAVRDATKSSKNLEFLDGLDPTITPVLDLSLVEEKARTLGDLLGIDSLSTDLSYINAQAIATTTKETPNTDDAVGGGDTYLNFVQNNNSPKALSTGDIYRGQKSQIALARKELGLVG